MQVTTRPRRPNGTFAHQPGDAYERAKARGVANIQSNRRWLRSVKTMLVCIDCGYDTNPDALQFDHVRGMKILAIGSMSGYPLWRQWEEMEKCDVRCANCHSIKSARERRT